MEERKYREEKKEKKGKNEKKQKMSPRYPQDGCKMSPRYPQNVIERIIEGIIERNNL